MRKIPSALGNALHFSLFFVLLMSHPACTWAANAVKLAEAGKVLATIEISPNASIATRSIAQEMAMYLERMVGAPFQITNTTKSGTRIVLGRSDEFPVYKADLVLNDRGEEAFLMRANGDRVLLLGATDRAVSHAAYTFLERLGVRWFFPTKEWEIVPNQSTLEVSFNEVLSPDFSYQRTLWYGSMTGYTTANLLRDDWIRHNRMRTQGPITSHSWIGLDPKQDFATHPEWFALVKGQRRNSKPNYGHPEVIKRAVEWAMQAADDGAKYISVSAPDGLNFCSCDLCLKMAGVTRESLHDVKGAIFGTRPDGAKVCVTSETIFSLANVVAEAVRKKHPDVMIGIFAYSGYSHPPSFNLAPNIYVAVTSAYRRTPLSFDEQIKVYGEKAQQLGIYDYYHVSVWYGWHPSKGIKMSDLRTQIPDHYAKKVRGINAEATNNWLPSGWDFYLSSKLMWDIHSDVDALYADFLENAFGKARVPMKRYYDRWESKVELNPATIGGALGDLISAYYIADTAEIKKRIAQLYLYNRFIHLGMEYETAAKDDTQKADRIGDEYADLFWRMKDTLLLHDLVTGGVQRPLVPGFTSQEIEKLMMEDAAWIGDSRVLFQTYSRDLVPVTTAKSSIAGMQSSALQTGRFRELQLIVLAQSGESVEATFNPDGENSRYRVSVMTPERFKAGDGAALADKIAEGVATGRLSFKAPRTGYYRVNMSNVSSINDINRPYVLEGNLQKFSGTTLYFYVPKGLRQFTLVSTAYGGPTIMVKDASDHVVFHQKGFAALQKVGPSNELRTRIQVPDGTGDAIWSVTGPGDVNTIGNIYFEGIPSYFCFNPQQLLVAREYLR